MGSPKANLKQKVIIVSVSEIFKEPNRQSRILFVRYFLPFRRPHFFGRNGIFWPSRQKDSGQGRKPEKVSVLSVLSAHAAELLALYGHFLIIHVQQKMREDRLEEITEVLPVD